MFLCWSSCVLNCKIPCLLVIWTSHRITFGGEKPPDSILKEFNLFNFSCVYFFAHFWAVVRSNAKSVKRMNLWVCRFLWPKNQYGHHSEIGVWVFMAAQKWSKSAEKIEKMRKCRQLLGLNFRSGDWLLWWHLFFVFCWSKVKMWFSYFLDKRPCALHSKIMYSFKICILVKVEGMVVDNAWGIWQIFLSYLWVPFGSKVESLKKVKKLTFQTK